MTSGRFDLYPTSLPGVVVIQRKPIEDERGFFCRFFCADELREAGVRKPVAQINHTLTRNIGVVRGLHFQRPPRAETKMVSCLKGEVFDVAVDIRKGSPTFLQWHSEILSAANRKSLLIPEGFAHGFQTLTEDCELLYLHTEFYESRSEGGMNVRDPRIAIAWPREITELSARDQSHSFVGAEFEGIVV